MKAPMPAPIDPTVSLSQFVGSLPTLIAVLLTWIHSNSRMSDMQNNLNHGIDDTRDLLRAEFRRVEEVMDARLKHLEER
jgi:hypothetical protein